VRIARRVRQRVSRLEPEDLLVHLQLERSLEDVDELGVGRERVEPLPGPGAGRDSRSRGIEPVLASDEQAVLAGQAGLTIEPDVQVPVRARDFFGGRDPALARALTLRR